MDHRKDHRRDHRMGPYSSDWPVFEQTTTDASEELDMAPLADKESILRWTRKNCKYSNDVISRRHFVHESQASLQDLIRLHDGSCVAAPALNDHVLRQQRLGETPSLPHNKSVPLKRRDLDTLRETMRRKTPGYKLPGLPNKLPPAEWQLYAASDQRSGPGFLSVCYVDVTKAKRTAVGVEFPLESIKVNMGYLPSGDGRQSIQYILDILKKLADKNKLLVQAVRGWKPVAGFPFTKSHWTRDRSEKLSELYQDLIALN